MAGGYYDGGIFFTIVGRSLGLCWVSKIKVVEERKMATRLAKYCMKSNS